MLLKESDSEVSTVKEDVGKETPRPSYSTFRPCSLKVLLLITIPTLLGYWITRGISPAGNSERLVTTLQQTPIIAYTAETLVEEALVMYAELSLTIERKGCQLCCVFSKHLNPGREEFYFDAAGGWIDPRKTVRICTQANQANQNNFHLRMTEKDKTFVIDVELQDLPDGLTRHGLLYGEWFWIVNHIVSNKKLKHYLVCNMLNGGGNPTGRCP